MKECLLNLSYAELENLIISLGEKKFRTGQIFRALHLGLEFNDMTDLSKVFREKLADQYDAQPVRIIKHLHLEYPHSKGKSKYKHKYYDKHFP